MFGTYILADNIVISQNSSTIIVNKKEIELRPQCHKLLMILADLKGNFDCVPFKIIGDRLWQEDGGWGYDKQQSLKDCVTELRKVVPYIKNIRGKGYELSCSVVYVPPLIIYTIEPSRTRPFYHYEFDMFKLHSSNISENLKLIVQQTGTILSKINTYIDDCNNNSSYSQIFKKQLMEAMVSLNTFEDDMFNRFNDLSKLDEKGSELLLAIQRHTFSFEETKEERKQIKRHYYFLQEWCFTARKELSELEERIEILHKKTTLSL